MAVVMHKLDGGFEFSALGDGSDMAYTDGAGWDDNHQYLRISRLGDIFTLQTGNSVDNLTSSYADTLTMPESLYVGFDVGSNVSGTLHSAKFNEVSIVNVSTQCGDEWCSVEQGTPSPAGSFTVDGNSLTVNGGQNRLFVYQTIKGNFALTAHLAAVNGSTDNYRAACLKILRARVYQKIREGENAKRQDKAAEEKKIEWGSQIRNYVLHPYNMVKDLRTSYETSNTAAVLDGDLDNFINECPLNS